MRIVLLAATAVLAAGCSDTVGGQAEQSGSTTAKAATTVTTTRSAPATAAPSVAPAAGAPMPTVIAWVTAGTKADTGGFHSATRDGVTTALGTGIAFLTATGVKCMTNGNNGGALACLADLTDPPKPPADVSGEWIGGWIDFDGTSAQVGSVHGDPGVFTEGTGARLENGSSLRFGDDQCRADAAALICINYAHQSGVRITGTGVTPLGCLQPAGSPQGGTRFQFSVLRGLS